MEVFFKQLISNVQKVLYFNTFLLFHPNPQNFNEINNFFNDNIPNDNSNTLKFIKPHLIHMYTDETHLHHAFYLKE